MRSRDPRLPGRCRRPRLRADLTGATKQTPAPPHRKPKAIALKTILTAELLRAYRETEYRVFAPQPFALRVDLHSPALASLHALRHASCSAYLSACNPLSEPLDESANAALHVALGKSLSLHGLHALEGIGTGLTGAWPGEPSYLVLNLSLARAREWGHAWRQNAILWSGADAVPRLTLLR